MHPIKALLAFATARFAYSLYDSVIDARSIDQDDYELFARDFDTSFDVYKRDAILDVLDNYLARRDLEAELTRRYTQRPRPELPHFGYQDPQDNQPIPPPAHPVPHGGPLAMPAGLPPVPPRDARGRRGGFAVPNPNGR